MNRAAGLRELFRNLPIRYKLLLVYSTIFTVAIALGSLVIYTSVRNTIEIDVEKQLKTSTDTLVHMVRTGANLSIRNHLREVVERDREMVAHLYHRYQSGELTEEEAMQRATDILLHQTVGQTGYVYCINSQGVMLVHPSAALRSEDFSRFPFIQEQMKRKEGYLEYQWKNPGEPHERAKALYMTYFAPWDWIISASSYREEFMSLVDVNDFRESVLSIRFGETGYCYVMDTKGNFVIHPKLAGNVYNFGYSGWSALFKQICDRKNGKIIYDWKNPGEHEVRKKLALFEYLPEFDWIVVSSSYLDEFNAPLKAIRYTTILTVALTLLPVLLLTLWMSRSITRPLQALTERFSAGIDGSLAVRVDIRSRDEIGRLAGYFNDFMAKLEASQSSLRAEIAERVRAENELKEYQEHLEELVEERTTKLAESENRFRSIFEASNDAIMLLAEEGFFDCNSRTLEMFGFKSKEDFIKTHPADISPPIQPDGRDSVSSARANTEEALKVRHLRFEWVHRRCDGRDFPAEVLLSAFSFGGRAVLHSTVRDITERKKAEEALRESERQLADIIAFLPDPTVVIDAQGRITAWNRAMEKMTGKPAEDMLGKGNYEYSIPFYGERKPILIDLVMEPVEEVLSKYSHLGRQGNTLTGQGLISNLGTGDLHFVGSASALRDASGNIIGAIESVRDVTDRIRAEEALKESYARLEEANSRIMESIGYARIIQGAILPNREEIMRYAKDSFLIWRPKDVIGGDMFWVDTGRKQEFLMAVIDCTGHGVPGAIMTMIAATTLDRVVDEVGYGDPAVILGKLNIHVQRSLHQQTSDAESNDGLDIGLCHIDCAKGILTYAGARISLLCGASGRILEIKGDRQSIGYKSSDINYVYASHRIPIDSGMAFYMHTDGLTDQVGGGRSFPFGKKRLVNFLAEHHTKPLRQQEKLLLETLESYRGEEQQRDDIMIMGFRL